MNFNSNFRLDGIKYQEYSHNVLGIFFSTSRLWVTLKKNFIKF